MHRIASVTLATILSLPILAAVASPTSSPKLQPTSKKSSQKAGTPAAKKSKSSGPAKVAAKPVDKSKARRFDEVAPRGEELRGIWITTDEPRDWNGEMKKLKNHGLNAVFVRVAQGGKAIYPSKVLPQDQWATDSGEDELAKAIDAAHRNGLQFHAWKVSYHLSSPKFRPPGSAAHSFYDRLVREDRLLRDSKGVQTHWLNPADPRNQDLEARVAAELVQRYDVDGYHLDYIRYPDSSPGFDFRFGAVARCEFEKSLGKPVADWPADVISGSLKQRYDDWERDNVTNTVRKIHSGVKRHRPEVLVSAAVRRGMKTIPSLDFHRAFLKQDWARWAREGLIDFVVPMTYFRDSDDFREELERDLSYVRGRLPLVAGIGNWQLATAGDLVEQVRIARELGADGFVLFSLDADDISQQLTALAAGATRQPTAPAIGTHRFEFLVSKEIVARRYGPFVVEAGRSASVKIKPAKSAPEGDSTIVADICMEDLQGKRLDEPRRVTFKNDRTETLTFTASKTAVRPVIRVLAGKSLRVASVVRGPILEPCASSEFAENQRREQPPQPSGSGLRVGVYFNGVGANSILETLQSESGISPVLVFHLRPNHLAVIDVLILPQLADLSDLSIENSQALRAWVERGGRLILTRDAAGIRWHPRLFAEIGTGDRIAGGRTVQLSTSLRGFSKGTKFDHECSDHVQLKLGSAGKQLVVEQKTGKPIVAAGRVGKGTVILNGLVPGYKEEAGHHTNSSRLLIALVHYR